MHNPQPPIAAKRPKTQEIHGKKRKDDYYWLRDKSDPKVIEHLKQENKYTDEIMSDTKDLQNQLFEEMKARIKETDTSAPVKIDNYYYYSRTVEGLDYPIYCRKNSSMQNEEEILLDQNELAKDSAHCSLGVFEVSPDHSLLAYSVDMEGSEKYTIYVKDLKSGEHFTDSTENTEYSFEWMNDNATFLYTTRDEIMRPSTVFMHTLGENVASDKQLLNESDERFYVDLYKSRSEQYIFVTVSSAITDEVHFMDASDKDASIQVIQPREQELEYNAEHHGENFFILTNDGAENFKLVKTPISSPGKQNWQEVIPHRQDVMLTSISAFKGHICVKELSDSIVNIRVWNLDTNEDHYLQFDEDVYSVSSGENPDFDSKILRFYYSSLSTPWTVFDYDMNTKTRKLVKQYEVLGGYNPNDYTTKRVYAEAQDGASIPISLVHRKDLVFTDSTPCYLKGYGAYGIIENPGFNATRINLLERGFVVAIAHIRGGCDKGRQWYENGKYLNKKNTFTDFIDTAEHLISEGYTSKSSLIAHGGSAGGMLIGAVLNMRPDLFGAAIADVPFVDVLNTMLDPSLPLTVGEYEEWGNPNDAEYYEYISSYSPYDNVGEHDYPHLLVTAGLNDPRVQYWEPAKWVVKLRDAKTDNNMLLLKTEMDKGHSGASGRYTAYKEIAFRQAFALKALGLHN